MLNQYTANPTVANEPKLPGDFPRLPDSVVQRFPEVQQYHEDSARFWRKVRQGMLDASEEVIRDIDTTNTNLDTYTATFQSADATLSASIATEASARASADVALASSITTLTSAYMAADTALASSITSEASTRASADSAEASTRSSADATLTTSIGTVSASVTSETAARVAADSAEAGTRSSADATLTTSIGTVSAAVTVEAAARVAADGAIYARWGVAIDINGRIAGRINLDGTNQSSTFLVAVDKFVVANANGTITALDIRAGGKIVMGADVQSDNYAAGSSGWRIERNSGNAEFNNGTFRGSLDINHGADNQVLVDGGGMSLGDRSGSRYIYAQNWSVGSSSSIGWRVQSGNYSSAFGSNNPYVHGFYVSHTSGLEAFIGLNPFPVIGLYGSGGSFYNGGTTTLIGDLAVNISGSLPGFGNTNTGFQVEAATGTIFASRSNNFCGSFNRNDDGGLILIRRGGSQVGSISVTSTNTSYNTSSDRRLKTAIVDAPDVGAIIDALPVREYEFLVRPDYKFIGFIAQELHEVFPDAVTPGDDEEEVVQQWSRDDSKLIPILIKEVQSLRARLAAVEAL